MRVLKFGGTSLSHAHRLDTVVSRVLEARKDGPVVVVVSALGGVTDELTEALAAARRGEPAPGLARRLRALHLDDPEERLDAAASDRLTQEIEPWLRELDQLIDGIARLGEAPSGAEHRLLALGERLSAPRVAAWLRASAIEAAVVDGTALVRADYDLTESRSAPPRIDAAATRRTVLEGLGGLVRGEVPVVTGFIGGDIHGRTLTLGRGASDLSATTLAAALQAEAVEIWSDTDGVLSADPRRVPSAVPLRELSFAQAASLARYGAKVLHPETLEPVRRAALPVFLRSTFHPGAPGTRLVEKIGDEKIALDTHFEKTSEENGVDQGESDGTGGDGPSLERGKPALAASTLPVVLVETRSAPGVPLASQALAVLERSGVAPLALACGYGRCDMWLRQVDVPIIVAQLRRQLRPLGGRVEEREAKSALALLPGALGATPLLAELARSLGERGLTVHALFADRVEGSGAFSNEPSGPELAVAIVDQGVADLALRTAHGTLVTSSVTTPGRSSERDLSVAASG